MSNAAFATKPDFQVARGQLWGGTNPTPGTGIAQAVSATFAETAALAMLRNIDTKAIRDGGRIIIPRYLRLITTVVPASATDAHLAIAVDDINRYTSGGSALTPGNSRSDQLALTTQSGRFDFGALVAPAAGANRKLITRKSIKRAIPVVGDEYVIIFGDVSEGTPQLLTGAAAQVFTVTTDPIALIPGGNHSLLFHLWYTSNAATPASYEYEVGWIEGVEA